MFEPGFPSLISLCNPGKTASELIGNPRREYVKWVEKFGRPLDEAMTVLTQPAKGNQSPIVEAIGDVVSRRENRVPKRRPQDPAGLGHAAEFRPVHRLRQRGRRTRSGAGYGACSARSGRIRARGSWELSVHQVQGVYDAARLEQAATLWKQAFQKLNISVSWDRL